MQDFKDWSERQTITERWVKTRMLDGVPEKDLMVMATCLDGQRVHNESGDRHPAWLRVSIPVVRRVFHGLKGVKYGSPTELSQWHETKVYWQETERSGRTGQHDLQAEADTCAVVSEKLHEELKALIAKEGEIIFHCFELSARSPGFPLSSAAPIRINYEKAG